MWSKALWWFFSPGNPDCCPGHVGRLDVVREVNSTIGVVPVKVLEAVEVEAETGLASGQGGFADHIPVEGGGSQTLQGSAGTGTWRIPHGAWWRPPGTAFRTPGQSTMASIGVDRIEGRGQTLMLFVGNLQLRPDPPRIIASGASLVLPSAGGGGGIAPGESSCRIRPVGVFATPSPVRPNPIAISLVEVGQVDAINGITAVRHIDVAEDCPILDIKPSYPNSDEVEGTRVPDWCSLWPASVEESVGFDRNSTMIM